MSHFFRRTLSRYVVKSTLRYACASSGRKRIVMKGLMFSGCVGVDNVKSVGDQLIAAVDPMPPVVCRA